MRSSNGTTLLLSSVLVLGLAACGSSDSGAGPAPDDGGADSTTTDSTTDSGTRDSTPPVDSGAKDTASSDTAVADSGAKDTAVADTAVADTAVTDTAVADSAVADTAVAETTPDTADTSTTSLTCGTAPFQKINVEPLNYGSSPPFLDVSSSICTAGEFLAVPTGGSGGPPKGTVELGVVAQYLIVNASDGSTVQTLSPELVPSAALFGTGVALPILSFAKTATTAFPTGFTPTSGASAILLSFAPDSSLAAPCNDNAGITLALDAASAAAHPEAQVFYNVTSFSYTSTGPTIAGQGAAIVLTPTGPVDYVVVQATKTGCKVDTGNDPAGVVRLQGMTGRFPAVPNSITQSNINMVTGP